MSIQQQITAYWDDRAPAYDAAQHRPGRDAEAALWADVWSSALPADPVDVLDLGTGSGHAAIAVARLGHRVTGLDLSTEMVRLARRRAGAMGNPPRFVVGDAADPDLPGTFDVLVSRYLLWTLREPDVAVRRWHRLLRPGGRVAMVDSTWFPEGLPGPEGELGAAYDDRVRRVLPLAEAASIEPTADLLRAAGLVDVEVTPLRALLELDLATGAAPGHEPRLQHLVTARLPA
ncbi:class I SAM-dependent methyltransferase [Nocardioides sp. AX2bis]|uniref:class I SAM-dependent methyltransferase n=1 Tax=Nocardioides sp. AX2bis TaxID=2653157 RepID=UPI0012F3BB0E|nr:class I SAM-dependent methyltransferase [Nocardioides sp. AX2bis]VXA96103.1 Methyltransferase domain-containing protein [Nocardioides sp. AX2bis]